MYEYDRHKKPPTQERKIKQGGWNQGIDRKQLMDNLRQKRIRAKWRDYTKKMKERYNT